MKIAGIILAYFAFFGVIIAIPLYHRSWKVKRCSRETNGTIGDYKCVRGTSRDTYYFLIDYSVDAQKFKLSQQVSDCNYSSCIGTAVTVHYDPEKPKRAWAETPGKHPYKKYVERAPEETKKPGKMD